MLDWWPDRIDADHRELVEEIRAAYRQAKADDATE